MLRLCESISKTLGHQGRVAHTHLQFVKAFDAYEETDAAKNIVLDTWNNMKQDILRHPRPYAAAAISYDDMPPISDDDSEWVHSDHVSECLRKGLQPCAYPMDSVPRLKSHHQLKKPPFSFLNSTCILLLVYLGSVFAIPLSLNGGEPPNTTAPTSTANSSSCFPSLNFRMPHDLPHSLDDWWCPMDTEYAFMGFSYEVTACQDPSQLDAEFADIRNHFKGRYVRLYGACDNPGFYDDIVDAAWNNSLGVHALIWFGFTGGNQWIARRDSLIKTLTTNPKAKFVTRGVQFGSEPLFDNVLPHSELAAQVISAKARLASVHVPVTVSELAYGYQERGGAQDVIDAIDFINIHMLPFFKNTATTGAHAWPLVEQDTDWFVQHGKGKKMYFDENGWPSITSPNVQPNSPNAVASISSEHEYYRLLDRHCVNFKNAPGGGIGWFAHLYSDNQQPPGYGIYNVNGTMKFPFQPRTLC